MPIKTIKGFKQAVKKLAKGDYHIAEHRVTEHRSGEVAHYWRAYTEKASFTGGHSTPEGALTELEKMCSKLG